MVRSVPTAGRSLPVGRAVLGFCLCLAVQTAWGQVQSLPKHYLYSSDWAPGAIGRRQLERGAPYAGYFQPVEVTGPAGSLISMSDGNPVDDKVTSTARAGMQIGYVYRLKVGNIKFREGAEVYPTIEVINRLYPPPGLETRFPIPIELTLDELQMAADGRYVTRVIYLEDPQSALPVRDEPGAQRYFEVARADDPLEIADRMGRPMAILRMGSRIPAANGDPGDQYFPQQLPPALPYQKPPAVARRDGLEDPIDTRLVQPRPQPLPPIVERTPPQPASYELKRPSISERLRPVQDPGTIRR